MKKTAREEAFENFIGSVAYEEDGGWSKEVWDAAWAAARACKIEDAYCEETTPVIVRSNHD